MAIQSDYITADMVEATEFPHLAIKYQVRSVPRTVINQTHFVDGMVPEAEMLERVLLALGEPEAGAAAE